MPEPPNQHERTLDQLWPQYLQGGYFDATGNLKAEYVSRDKVRALVREMGSSQPPLMPNQLRRFFQHCRAIEARLRITKPSAELTAAWRANEADFRKLDVAAADAWGKSPKKIPKLFHDFIQRNVAEVKTAQHFLKGFLPHFEAVVGFGAEFLKDQRS